MIRWARLAELAKRMDWMMNLSIISLALLGVLFIYSASFQNVDSPVNNYYQRQIIWILAGLVIYFFVVAYDYRQFQKSAAWIYAICMVLLILVLLIGAEVNEAHRWLNLFGIRVQPSEVAKIGVLVMLAQFLSRPGKVLQEPKYVLQSLLLVGIPFILIVVEPDLGTGMVLAPLVLILMYIAGIPKKYLLLLILLGLLLMPVAYLMMGDYRQDRILTFLDANRDPYGAGWNRRQSEIAVGSGGLMGKGFLQGTQNILGYLPRAVAPTDFIFSVIAEETGFVGAMLIIALYAALLIAGVRAAIVARDKFGRLLAVGVVTLIFSHVFINIAMTIGLMPITGLPLPLISYGGSFMISTMMALGLVQSVYVRRYRQ